MSDATAAEPVRIRDADARDGDLLVRFATAMARETEGLALDPAVLGPGVAALLADPRKGRVFVLEEDGTAVATLMLTTEWSDWRDGWWWWIQSVYVAPEARRLGVFRALYAHVEAEARATPGVCGLRLYVENANARAQATYAALGMVDAHYRVFEAEFPRA